MTLRKVLALTLTSATEVFPDVEGVFNFEKCTSGLVEVVVEIKT